jgi:hypothetical protein
MATIRAGDPLNHVAGEIHDVDVPAVIPEFGDEELFLVAVRVCPDEGLIGGDGAA